MTTKTKIIMAKKTTITKDTLVSKFKILFKKEVEPRVKKKDKLGSEIDKLYFERSKLESEISKLDSEIDKLDSERNKLYSKRNKLDSDILMFFYKFEKENKCQVVWNDYSFKLEEIELKIYNLDKTGFIFYKMNRTSREELFEKKIPEIIEQNGKKYKLIE